MNRLQISDSLSLPVDAATGTFGILATKGAGKSNAAVVMAEEMYDAGVPWVAVDPKGDWWGLRSSQDGKGPGLPIIVFGGRHADVPLEPTAGALIADLVLAHRLTCVLDVSQFTKADTTRLLLAFGKRLFAHADDNGAEPLHLFLEEAHEYLPQVVKGDQSDLVNIWQRIVKQGRFKGLGCTLISQRSSVLNKDVLELIDTLIVLRTIGPLSRKSIAGWVQDQDVDPTLMGSLPSLSDGEAWLWSPGALHLSQRIQFRRRRTFDSGATPKVGESRKAPATLADVDLGAIKEAMAATIEKAKADDPKELRKQIAELKKVASKPVQEINVQDAINDATTPLLLKLDQMEAVYGEAREIIDLIADHQSGLMVCLERLRSIFTLENYVAKTVRCDVIKEASARKLIDASPRPAIAKPAAAMAPGAVPNGCAKPLAALAAVFPSGLTDPQWATAAGYKRSGGTWGTYKSRLRTVGLIETREGRWFATEAGAAACGDVVMPPPPGPDLVRWWAAKLPGTTKIAESLIEAWPDGLTKDELALRVDMTASGGSFGTYLSRLAGPGLITREGGVVRLADEVMER